MCHFWSFPRQYRYCFAQFLCPEAVRVLLRAVSVSRSSTGTASHRFCVPKQVQISSTTRPHQLLDLIRSHFSHMSKTSSILVLCYHPSQTYSVNTMNNISATCPKSVPKVSRKCPKCGPNMSDTCAKHVRKVSAACPEHSRNMSDTCQQSLRIVTENALNNAEQFPTSGRTVSEKCSNSV
jgi:hypothetical protein